MFNPLQMIFGTKFDRDLKKLKPFVHIINSYEEKIKQIIPKRNRFISFLNSKTANPSHFQLIPKYILHIWNYATIKYMFSHIIAKTVYTYLSHDPTHLHRHNHPTGTMNVLSMSLSF